MSKVKQHLSSRLNCFVSEFGARMSSTDGKVLYCNYCDVKVGSEKRFNVTQHINTDKHKNFVKRKEKNQNALELGKVQQLVCVVRNLLSLVNVCRSVSIATITIVYSVEVPTCQTLILFCIQPFSHRML
ncbi:uncharacterized protein LOC111036924 [Myzus persicae]|uniref:uncharacterized protein LOC111036924 n=1 Tax=Myzus persicae TaxID=13164 RepID=UPI000B937CAF|nr:uncharacterized protein LOC111036924 [Myzus persicae]